MRKSLKVVVRSSEEFICNFDDGGKMYLELRNTSDKVNEAFNKTIMVSICILL